MSHYEYDFMANLPSLADVAFDLDDLFTPVYFSTLNIWSLYIKWVCDLLILHLYYVFIFLIII